MNKNADNGISINFLAISILSVAFLFNTSISSRIQGYSFYFLLGLYLASVLEISFMAYLYRKWKKHQFKLREFFRKPEQKNDANAAVTALVFLFLLIVIIFILTKLGLSLPVIISEFQKFFGLVIG